MNARHTPPLIPPCALTHAHWRGADALVQH